MKDVTIKGLSVDRVALPRQQLLQAMDPAPVHAQPGASVPYAHLAREFLRLDSPADGTADNRQELYKVTLDVQGAAPAGDSADIWVGDQLVLGTVLHEREQTITGYVRRPPADPTEVRICYGDGSAKIFQLDARGDVDRRREPVR